MKKFKVIILTLFLFSLSVFFITQLGLTQDTWSERMEERRERFREKIREKLIEEKREELSKIRNKPLTPNIGLVGCGNGVCEDDETDRNCRQDCCNKFFEEEGDKICMKKGWKKEYINVDDRPRKLLWKAPEKWGNGAIIILHGGGFGAYGFCGESYLGKYLLNEPEIEFTEMAISEGFAVFSLDSAFNLATDAEGRGIGKRFDFFALESRDNFEVPFVRELIDNFIPAMRPENSNKAVFVVGHSTGAFTSVIVSTQLSDKVTAFVPVAGGDPYGMHGDMGYIHPTKKMRKCVPGTVIDNENNALINARDACVSKSYPNEVSWPETKKSIPFKQFIHEDDGLVNMSCMKKAQEQLVAHGYQDDGPFILDRNIDPITPNLPISQGLENHFWQEQYSQPILDFFKKHSSKSK